MLKIRLYKFLLSLLCSLMIASSQPSTSLFADIGSVPLESILDSVANSGWAGVAQVPSASDVPKVVSPQPVANGSEAKNKEDQEPLKDVALVGLTFGKQVTLNLEISRFMGIASGDTAPAAKMLVIQSPNERELLYVFQNGNGNGNGNSTHIIIGYRTENEGTFCLTSLDGKLKSAVFAKKGEELVLLPIEQEAKKFESKKQWWINKAKELNQQSSRQR